MLEVRKPARPAARGVLDREHVPHPDRLRASGVHALPVHRLQHRLAVLRGLEQVLVVLEVSLELDLVHVAILELRLQLLRAHGALVPRYELLHPAPDALVQRGLVAHEHALRRGGRERRGAVRSARGRAPRLVLELEQREEQAETTERGAVVRIDVHEALRGRDEVRHREHDRANELRRLRQPDYLGGDDRGGVHVREPPQRRIHRMLRRRLRKAKVCMRGHPRDAVNRLRVPVRARALAALAATPVVDGVPTASGTGTLKCDQTLKRGWRRPT